MRALWVVILAVAACAPQSEVVQCSDGRVCPEGYTCSTLGCLSRAQTVACEGLADGDTCTTTGGEGSCREGGCISTVCGNAIIEPGEICDDGNQFSGDGCNGSCSSDERCGNGLVELEEQCDCGAVDAPSSQPSCAGSVNGGIQCTQSCKLVRCGNGELDPGELCDDGNVVPRDGCSFDCLSDETCGNGTLDFFAGEQCDDGNTRTVDGCSSTCRVEPMAWTPLDIAKPPPTSNPAAAYDTARGTLVVFGGSSSGSFQDTTWELDGTTWTRANAVFHPGAREGTALAYDAKRRRVLLFGGINSSATLADTWEYDGTTWKLLSPPTSPPARHSHRMVYDSARERIVLFGGQSNYCCTRTNDVWEWDGTTWTQVTPAGSLPPARAQYGMAYDPIRGLVVVFGGIDNANAALGDTWEYNGSAWTSNTSTGPTARSGASLTFDVKRAAIVMTGLTETWTLDRDGWTEIATADPDRRFHAAAYDVERGAVVIFGGLINSSGQQTADIRVLGSTTWSTPAIAEPANQANPTVTFDTLRGRLVLLTISGQTWELSGTSWRQILISGPAPNRTAAGIAFDAVRGVTVLFGGNSSGTRLGDTWEYDGASWTQVVPAASPSARSNHRMVYDSVRKRVVLFGGMGAAAQNDTWEYDGATWTQVSSTVKPSARSAHAMAYDAGHQRVVMIGSPGNETWVLDSTGWHQLATSGPTLDSDGALAYDVARNRVVLHGGFHVQALDETWELVDDSWVHVIPDTVNDLGPARWQLGLVYDPIHARTILFGGVAATAPYTWVYAAAPIVAGEVCTRAEDNDGDGLVSCADDDCWAYCTPNCMPDAPTSACTMTPRCGDGVCGGLENCRFCPADCAVGAGSCPIECGDGYCDGTETAISCPGDCG